jgi:Ni/Co efflux regulator RcnB
VAARSPAVCCNFQTMRHGSSLRPRTRNRNLRQVVASFMSRTLMRPARRAAWAKVPPGHLLATSTRHRLAMPRQGVGWRISTRPAWPSLR